MSDAAERIAVLAGVSARLAAGSCDVMDETLREVLDDLLLHLDAHRWTMVLAPGGDTLGGTVTPIVSAAVEEALVHRFPHVVVAAGAGAEARTETLPALLRDEGVASVLAVPTSVGSEVLGVIVFERLTPAPWLPPDVGLSRAIADIVGGALARCRAEHIARRADDRYRRLLQTSAEGVCLLDADGVIRFANQSFVTLLGGGAAGLEGVPILRYLVGPDAWSIVTRLLHDSGRFEFEVQRRDGTRRWLGCSTSALREDVDGGRALVMVTDISIRRAAEAALRHSEARFRALVRSSSDVIVVTDHTGAVAYASPSTRDVLGFEPEALHGTSPLDLVHPDDLPEVAEQVTALWEARTGSLVVRCRIITASGEPRPMEAALTNLIDDDAVSGMTITARDISEQLELQAALTFDATHDPVTGLPNRRVFNDRVEEELEGDVFGLTLLFADLDGFKEVNDTHGHDVGDELLRLVGQRLQRAVRDGDVVVRHGGDEFAILCPGLTSPDEAATVAGRVVAAVRAPFSADGREIGVGVSIGIAQAHRDASGDGKRRSAARQARELLTAADAAMYAAKRNGHGWVFAPTDGTEGPTAAS